MKKLTKLALLLPAMAFQAISPLAAQATDMYCYADMGSGLVDLQKMCGGDSSAGYISSITPPKLEMSQAEYIEASIDAGAAVWAKAFCEAKQAGNDAESAAELATVTMGDFIDSILAPEAKNQAGYNLVFKRGLNKGLEICS